MFKSSASHAGLVGRLLGCQTTLLAMAIIRWRARPQYRYFGQTGSMCVWSVGTSGDTGRTLTPPLWLLPALVNTPCNRAGSTRGGWSIDTTWQAVGR